MSDDKAFSEWESLIKGKIIEKNIKDYVIKHTIAILTTDDYSGREHGSGIYIIDNKCKRYLLSSRHVFHDRTSDIRVKDENIYLISSFFPKDTFMHKKKRVEFMKSDRTLDLILYKVTDHRKLDRIKQPLRTKRIVNPEEHIDDGLFSITGNPADFSKPYNGYRDAGVGRVLETIKQPIAHFTYALEKNGEYFDVSYVSNIDPGGMSGGGCWLVGKDSASIPKLKEIMLCGILIEFCECDGFIRSISGDYILKFLRGSLAL